jgi:hypothetical protein
MWLKMETKPVWGTLQLWIFLSCNTTGAIDAFTRRVGRWELNHFVAALWIFRKCSGIGVGPTISWGAIYVEIEPRGAEPRSILPRYVSKNGISGECDVPIMWNPLHSHKGTSKTNSFRFSSTSPSKYHVIHRHMNISQIDDTKASVRTLCTHPDIQKHPSGYWVHNCPKLCGVVSFGGQNISFWNVKITFTREDRDNSRPIIVATHHIRSGMI